MALADYRLCDVCDAKVFYDANLNYDFNEYPGTGLHNLGDWAVLCCDCAKTHRVELLPAAPAPKEKPAGAPIRWEEGEGQLRCCGGMRVRGPERLVSLHREGCPCTKGAEPLLRPAAPAPAGEREGK